MVLKMVPFSRKIPVKGLSGATTTPPPNFTQRVVEPWTRLPRAGGQSPPLKVFGGRAAAVLRDVV